MSYLHLVSYLMSPFVIITYKYAWTCTLRQIKRDKIGWAYSSHGAKRNVRRVLVGKPEG
jgi:hypothetical protein